MGPCKQSNAVIIWGFQVMELGCSWSGGNQILTQGLGASTVSLWQQKGGQTSFKLLCSLECALRDEDFNLGWEVGKGCLPSSNEEEEQE